MGDHGAALGEPSHLAVGEMDRVRQDRPWSKPTGAVVDIGVVERLGEEPPHLRDLSAILREMGLPVRPRVGGGVRRRAEHRRGAAHCEAWREGVHQAPVVPPVPGRAQLG